MDQRADTIKIFDPPSWYPPLAFGASLLAAPLLALRPRGRASLSERYGSWKLPAGPVIWLHGASLGEIQGLSYLVEKIRIHFPHKKVLMTATSRSGRERAILLSDYQRLLMLDHPVWIDRALRGVTIEAFFFGETELWPNLLAHLARKKVPSVLVNGRISDFSSASYRRFRGLFRPGLQSLRQICCSGDDDADRFIELGASPERVVVTGNAKYSQSRQPLSSAEHMVLRQELFGSRQAPILVLGSLRKGEERFWIEGLQSMGQKLSIVIAPRQREEVPYFLDAFVAAGIPVQLRSAGSAAPIGSALMLDSHGELARIYQVADCIFVGGSLIDYGGHNVLEAVWNAPIVMGPYRSQVREPAEALAEVDGLLTIKTPEDIEAILRRVITGDEAFIQNAERSRAVAQRFAAAGGRLWRAVCSAVPELGVHHES